MCIFMMYSLYRIFLFQIEVRMEAEKKIKSKTEKSWQQKVKVVIWWCGEWRAKREIRGGREEEDDKKI